MEDTPDAAASPGPERRGASLRRLLALRLWRLARPWVRPALIRVRGFLMAETHHRLAALEAELRSLRTTHEAAHEAMVRSGEQARAAQAVLDRSRDAALTDLAASLEAVLLTLALDRRGGDAYAAAETSDEPAADAAGADGSARPSPSHSARA